MADYQGKRFKDAGTRGTDSLSAEYARAKEQLDNLDPEDVEAAVPKKKPSRVARVLSWILILVGVGLIGGAAFIFVRAQLGYQEAIKSYDSLVSNYTQTGDADDVPQINFDELAAVNPDIVGWIYVPNTKINYPVVQTSDNTKYLTYLFDGTWNNSGTIFLDCDDTAPGVVDQQTTIYGHHMDDGEMFELIADAASQETFDTINTVYYITRTTTYKLKPIFLRVVDGSTTEARTANFENNEAFQAYLKDMLANADARVDDAEDQLNGVNKVVTLVTCQRSVLANGRAAMVCKIEEAAARK